MSLLGEQSCLGKLLCLKDLSACLSLKKKKRTMLHQAFLLIMFFSWLASFLETFYPVGHTTLSIIFFSFTPLIRASNAISSINSSTLSISLLNVFKYTLINSSFTSVIPKSSVELFLARILVLKCATSLIQRSLKLMTESDFGLLYHALTEPLKVVGRILHMKWLSWMISSTVLRIFYTCSLGSVSPS